MSYAPYAIMRMYIIAAASENNVIGRKGELPWRQSTDLQRYRALTSGKTIIMGRKTHEAIGRPLPNRVNIVITRQEKDYPGCVVVHSLDEALAAAKRSGAAEAWVIGGGELYREALPVVDRIELTRIHVTIPDGDAFFPELDLTVWKEVMREDHPADEKNEHAYTFLTYEKAPLP